MINILTSCHLFQNLDPFGDTSRLLSKSPDRTWFWFYLVHHSDLKQNQIQEPKGRLELIQNLNLYLMTSLPVRFHGDPKTDTEDVFRVKGQLGSLTVLIGLEVVSFLFYLGD